MGRKVNQGSKWIRADKRLAIYLRDDFCCAYCGRDLTDAPSEERTLDHVQPCSHGGSNEAYNLVTACRSCNSARQDTPLRTWVRTRGLDVAAVINRVTRQRRRALAPYRAEARRTMEHAA